MSDIDKLQKMVIDFRDERDWAQFNNPKDSAISLLLEATEFLEHFNWLNPEEVKSHIKDEYEEVSDELVDVLYWVLLIAHDLKIPLDKALTSKMVKNRAKYPVKRSKGKHTNKYSRDETKGQLS